MTCLLVIAVAGALAFPAAQSADERELAQYRLTTETLTKIEAVAKAYEANMAKDPKMKRRLEAQRELAELDKKDNLTAAERKRAYDLEGIIGDASSELGIEGGSLSEISAQLTKIPAMAAALKSVGLPAREMAKFTVTAMQAAIASALGGAPPSGPAGENVKFVLANQAAIERINKLFGEK